MDIKNKKTLENFADKNVDVELGQELDNTNSKHIPLNNLNKDDNQEIPLNPQGSETYYEL